MGLETNKTTEGIESLEGAVGLWWATAAGRRVLEMFPGMRESLESENAAPLKKKKKISGHPPMAVQAKSNFEKQPRGQEGLITEISAQHKLLRKRSEQD